MKTAFDRMKERLGPKRRRGAAPRYGQIAGSGAEGGDCSTC